MTLSNGRSYLAIPGPSVMPDRVLQAMHRASPNIYEGELVEMMDGICTDLKAVARTEHQVAIYIGNGHAAWEAALSNTVQPGDTVLVLATGRFCIGWGEMASHLGVNVETIDFGKQTDIDLTQVAAALQADTSHKITAILAVHVDTSTSVLNDIAGLRTMIDAANHPALLMVDCIASLGVDRFEMDAWGVDVMVTGSQKGLMTPAGISFVFFNDKAVQARARLTRVSMYWDWTTRVAPEDFYQFWCGTAPTHHLYGLREALTILVHEEGLKAAWARQARLAQAVWTAFETWAVEGGVELNVADRTKRSHAVTAVHTVAPKATELRRWLEQTTGVTLGIGLGMALPTEPEWHGFFRVGHMGHVNAHMILGMLGSIESGLSAVNIPHNPGGVGAAAALLAKPHGL